MPLDICDKSRSRWFIQFVLIHFATDAGGWNVGAIAHAVAAEGAPLAVDRYTRVVPGGRLLCDANLFRDFDYSNVGGCFPSLGSTVEPQMVNEPDTPIAYGLADRLLALPPFTLVSQPFIRQCAAAIRKVTNVAANNSSLR